MIKIRLGKFFPSPHKALDLHTEKLTQNVSQTKI